MRLSGAEARPVGSAPRSDYAWTWYHPHSDGRYIFSSGTVFTREGKPTGTSVDGQCFVPSVDPRYLLAVAGYGPGPHDSQGRCFQSQISFCTAADRRVVYTLNALEERVACSIVPNKYGYTWDVPGSGEPLVWHIPSAELLVLVTGDQVSIRRFRLLEELDKTGEEYLFVDSLPPTETNAGARFSYQITAQAKLGGLRYKLEQAPAGMKVSDAGLVRWEVPSGQTDGVVPVIVTVSDKSGRDMPHSFDIAVRRR